MRNQILKVIFVFLFCWMGARAVYAGPFCVSPQIKNTDDTDYKATAFMPWNQLSVDQKRLLTDFFAQQKSLEESYNLWMTEHDDQAAMFLALTHALESTYLQMADDSLAPAISFITGVKELRGDRMIAIADQNIVKAWAEAGGKYIIPLPRGKSETGVVQFVDHSTKDAALHCGYDIQGYTKTNRVPHLHWNINVTDSSMDVHLDGYASWFLGFIPNPEHLSYENSDVRYWFDEYKKKFGDPGFVVQDMNPQDSDPDDPEGQAASVDSDGRDR